MEAFVQLNRGRGLRTERAGAEQEEDVIHRLTFKEEVFQSKVKSAAPR